MTNVCCLEKDEGGEGGVYIVGCYPNQTVAREAMLKDMAEELVDGIYCETLKPESVKVLKQRYKDCDWEAIKGMFDVCQLRNDTPIKYSISCHTLQNEVPMPKLVNPDFNE